MKKKIESALTYILKKIARLIIWKYRPGIVGITGSVGKTSAKFAIAAVLGKERRIRTSAGNFNSEIGLALTILGDWNSSDWSLISRDNKPGANRGKKAVFFLRAVLAGLKILITRQPYPEILILEYGVDGPGDMKTLLAVARPNVAVITAIGEIPVHVEFFNGAGELAREKARIIEQLPAGGFAILNNDDETVMDLKDRTRAHLLTFGFGRQAGVRIANFINRKEDSRPLGISFKLEYAGSFVPVRLDGVFGKTQAYASGAAAAVGLIFGLNLVKISESLKNMYVPPDHRLILCPGINDSYILDDAYNASPLSMRAALDTMRDLPAKRKIGVLGDMLEIGQYAVEAHGGIGEEAENILDILVTVGPRAKFIADGARKAGLGKKNIYSFDTPEEAIEKVKDIIKKGDLVLVKASHAIHLDKVVDSLKAF